MNQKKFAGAVVVAQLVEWSLPTPKVRSLNPVIGKLHIAYILSTVLKRKKGREWPIKKILQKTECGSICHRNLF